MPDLEPERHYRLGPLERRGYVAGWRAGQVGLVATTVCLAALVLAVSSASPAVVVAALLVVGGVVGATVPLRGRSADEWIPSLAAHLRRRGQRRILDIDVIEATIDGRSVGVVRHRSGALSCTLALDSSGISLLDQATRTRRVEGMSAALGGLAREGGCVDRVGWSASARAISSTGLLADLRRRGELGTPAAFAYRSVIEAVVPAAVERQILLSLRTPAARGAAGETVRIRALLEDEARFGALRVTDRSVVTWWVAEWPRHDVTAELLAPLLLADHHRTVAVVMEPVRPSAALRRAAAAKTSQVADAEIRRRAGFLADRSQQRRGAHVAEREAELVDGHGSLRLAGFLAVEVAEDEDLDGVVAETELAAAQARLVLRRLQGDHSRGLVATLPLCAGLP